MGDMFISQNVFVSHPYADDPAGNIKKADLACKLLQEKYPDHLILSPLHAFSYLDDDSQRDRIMAACKNWIEDSATKIFISLGLSRGCIQELKWAQNADLPIAHYRLHNDHLVNVSHLFADFLAKELNGPGPADFEVQSFDINCGVDTGEFAAGIIKKIINQMERDPNVRS